ncbi:MAG: acetyl-CoA decarbonylase/synthase complex subunit gamma [Candidatus Hadarchaeales archaeon]
MAAKKKIGPLDIYALLPKTNCGKCEPGVCMAFAARLAERTISLEECPPLWEKGQEANLKKLQEMLKPPVKEVKIGDIKVGGQLVVRRHEYRYFNPVPLALTLEDTLSEVDLLKRIKKVEEYGYSYIGKTLRLDMLAPRYVSGDPSKFEATVRKASLTKFPLVLWCTDPGVMEKAVSLVKDRRPLLYAATKENWKEMGELALKYQCPLALYSPFDLKTLKSMAKTMMNWGLQDLLLDPGAGFGEMLKETVNCFTVLRNTAIRGEDPEVGFPLIASVARVWEDGGRKPEELAWEETALATILMVRYADLIILKSEEIWTWLPLIILRENIYTDPRKPVSVEPGMRAIGEVNENSPVMVTSNFALTYFTVASDIENSKVPSYLIVVDTGGLSVESSIAGRKMTAQTIADAIKASNVKEKVKHRKVILPGMAARYKGELEELLGFEWEVMIGPRDSSGIPKFLAEHWK